MKAILQLRHLLALILFLMAANCAVSQPTLGMAAANNQTILYYSPGATNYIVESTTNLATPTWAAAPDATPITAISVSNTTPARYFRLSYTPPPAGMGLIPAGWFTIGNSIG